MLFPTYLSQKSQYTTLAPPKYKNLLLTIIMISNMFLKTFPGLDGNISPHSYLLGWINFDIILSSSVHAASYWKMNYKSKV